MSEDRPEDIELPADSGRAKRPPPTIDLEATEVSGETRSTGTGAKPKRSFARPSAAAISAAIIAAVTGAGAAALVMAVALLLGLSGETAPPAPPVNTSAINDLAARIAGIESKLSKPATPAPDPALASRLDALEKSAAALRGELAALRAQSDKLAANVNDVKSAPGETAPPPDLAAINARIAELEREIHAQASAEGGAKPADDVPLRRIVAAALLDVLVRTGEPYPAALTTAKALAPNPDAFKPLDAFAATGVPNAFNLSRELLALVPKLSPPPENSSTGADLVGRLKAGAEKLVRIERTDAAAGNDRGAIVARVTAAALRSDLNEARRELKTLAPADRAAAQAWLDKMDARDAAFAASRQFAAEALTALAKPAP